MILSLEKNKVFLSLQMVKCRKVGQKAIKIIGNGVKNQNCIEITIKIDAVLKSINFRISPTVQRNIIETT